MCVASSHTHVKQVQASLLRETVVLSGDATISHRYSYFIQISSVFLFHSHRYFYSIIDGFDVIECRYFYCIQTIECTTV